MPSKDPNCKQTPPHAPLCHCATPPEPQWLMIGRGQAGWHAEKVNTSSSGGSLDNYTYWTGQKCYGYLAEAVEGCFVYDGKEADPAAYAHFIINGPMLNVSLPPDGIDRFTDRAAAGRMLPGLDGAFGTIAALAQDETYSGLDQVGIDIYRGLLRQVPGVKIGTVRGGIIVWE